MCSSNMAYIVGLVLILGIIFSVTSGNGFISNLWDSTTKNISGLAFPKTQKEIVIDNLNSQYDLLDKFFSDTALSLLQNEDIPAKDKKAIQGAIQSFGNSKDLVSQIGNLNRDDKSVTKALIKKMFDLDSEPGPNPTYIPPNCELACK